MKFKVIQFLSDGEVTMQRKSNQICGSSGNVEDVCLCPIGGIIETVSKKWALQIIATIGNYGKLRFTEIMEKLGYISPTSLTDRLKELETAGLIKREAFAEIPPRVEYSLTKDGMDLRKAVMPLIEWTLSRQSR
jgi:DNA-binding HxlR family transcriptional regulator